MSENQQKAKILGGLAEMFRRDLSATALTMMVDALSDVSAGRLNAACNKATNSCKFFPSVSELRELAGIPSAEDRADMAWQDVCGAISSCGSYRCPHFEDPIIPLVIRLMARTWPDFCGRAGGDSLYDHGDFDIWGQKDFKRMYRRLAIRPQPTDTGPMKSLSDAKEPRVMAIAASYHVEQPAAQLEDQSRPRPLLKSPNAC